MKKKFNILITASSRRVAMVRGFHTALEKLDIGGKVIAADTDPLSSSLRFCHKYHKVPLSSSKNYIPEILRIC